tara:strand:+ start:887 stop:1399 length:513 start_codon:yes stop_codon:yes gene_type:complete
MRNVEILLSGESRNTTPLRPKIISDLVPKLDWHEVRSIKGEAQVGGVTLEVHMSQSGRTYTKDVENLAGIIDGASMKFEESISNKVLDFLVDEKVFTEPSVVVAKITVQRLENTSYTRSYRNGLDVKGECSVEITFKTQEGYITNFIEEDLKFSAKMAISYRLETVAESF